MIINNAEEVYRDITNGIKKYFVFAIEESFYGEDIMLVSSKKKHLATLEVERRIHVPLSRLDPKTKNHALNNLIKNQKRFYIWKIK